MGLPAVKAMHVYNMHTKTSGPAQAETGGFLFVEALPQSPKDTKTVKLA